MHYKVFLDTNIYDKANYSFRNDLFSNMKIYSQEGILELQINSAVKKEVQKHIKSRIKETARNLNQLLSSRDLQLFRTIPEYKLRMETNSPKAWADKALSEFDILLEACNTEEISSNEIDVEGILDDYFNMRYPFEAAKKEEFPDAIIVRAIAQEIKRLSEGNVFLEYTNRDDLNEDLIYCVVSEDKGFRAAINRIVGDRPGEDVKCFSSLNELINFFTIQDERAAELQEKLNNGYAKELIETTIEEGVSSAGIMLDEPDGYVEDISNMGTGDYQYDAYVVGLQEMSDGTTYARIYIEASFVVMLEYTFLNAMESYWDREDQAYLWRVMTDKVANFKANATIGFTINIDKNGIPEFNDYIETPSDIEVNYSNLIDVISSENRDSW